MEFTAGNTVTWRMCGLGNGDSSVNYTDIEYAFYLEGSGNLHIYESGNYRGQYGTYTGTDQLKVAVEGGVVKYYRNSTLVYTSTVAPQYPLLVDASLNTVNTSFYELTNVVIATTGSAASNVRYVLSDVQGSSRAVMNNNGAGASTVVARHDYLPFGQELGSLTGLRSSTQGYGASDTNRQKYGMTERDDTTGLDHTWWRKYENTAGRWTSPDPLAGSIADPQSFNRYAYTQNDPVNFIDPTGLGAEGGGGMCYLAATGTYWDYKDGTRIEVIKHKEWRCIGGNGGGRGGGGFVGDGGGGPQNPTPITVRYMNPKYVKDILKALQEAEKRLQKADCAKLFGKSAADLVNMLENTEYRVLTLASGGPKYDPNTGEVSVVGAQTNSPTSVFINDKGPFFNNQMFVPGKSGLQNLDLNSGLRGAQFGALLLLHELGHQTGFLGLMLAIKN